MGIIEREIMGQFYLLVSIIRCCAVCPCFAVLLEYGIMSCLVGLDGCIQS